MENFCDKCKTGHTSAIIRSDCRSDFSVINNCKKYADNSTPPDSHCLECKKGFYL